MFTWHLDQLKTQTSLPEEGVGLWLPSEQTSHHRIPVPSAPKRKWAAMLPWLMEDRVLEPVEKMHFTVVARHEDQLDVIAMRRSDLDACLETAGKVGVQLLAAQPDYLALPWYPGEVVVAWRLSGTSRVLVIRTSETGGFAASESLAEALIEKCMEGTECELVALMPEEALPAFLRSRPVNCVDAPDWHSPMKEGISLLSGDYAVRQESAAIDKRALWATAALLVLALVLSFFWLKADVSNTEAAVATLQNAQQRQFSQLFPGLGNAGNSGEEMRDTLETLQSDRFLQREKLDQPLAALLLGLDGVLADCACELTGIELTSTGVGRLNFSSGAPAGLTTIPGYSVTNGLDEDGSTQTTISLIGGRGNTTRVAQ